MNQITQKHMPYNTGCALELLKGDVLRIEGRTTVDAVFFDLHNVRERFDQARTKINNSSIFVSTGNMLYSKSNLPMLTIVADSLGIGYHDLQFGMCSAAGYALFKGPLYESYRIKERFGVTREQIPDHGCWENLTGALRPWAIAPEDIPSPFNIFQETKIDGTTGRMELVYKQLAEPARIELRAEMDCLVGLSACPWLGRGLPIDVSVSRDN
ncbi:MAG: DUF1989 domain-containing protein [Rhizobiaceae bacterium]